MPKKKATAQGKKVTARAPAKAETRKERKTGELVRVRSSDLRKKAEAGDVDAAAALERIQKAYSKLGKTKGKKADVSHQCRDSLKAADAALANAVEAPLPAGVVETVAYRTKLENVELRWQELSDVKSGNIEARKHARENFKLAEQALSDAIEALSDAIEGSQLPLPGVG